MSKLTEQRLNINLLAGRVLEVRVTLNKRGLRVVLGSADLGPPLDQAVVLQIAPHSLGLPLEPHEGHRPVVRWSRKAGLFVGLADADQPGVIPLLVLPATVLQAYECSPLWGLGVQLTIGCSGGVAGKALRLEVQVGGRTLGVYNLPAPLVAPGQVVARPGHVGQISFAPFCVQWKQLTKEVTAGIPPLPPLAVPSLGELVGELMLSAAGTDFWSAIFSARAAGNKWMHPLSQLLATSLARRLCAAPQPGPAGHPDRHHLLALDWPGKGDQAAPIRRAQPVLLEVLLPAGPGPRADNAVAAARALERLPRQLFRAELRSRDGDWLTFALRHPARVIMEAVHLACCPALGASVLINLGPRQYQISFEAFAAARARKLGRDPLEESVARAVHRALEEVISAHDRCWDRQDVEPDGLSRIDRRLRDSSLPISSKLQANVMAVVVRWLLAYFDLTVRDAVQGTAPVPRKLVDQMLERLPARVGWLVAGTQAEAPPELSPLDAAVNTTAQELVSRYEAEVGADLLLAELSDLFQRADRDPTDQEVLTLRGVLEQRYLRAQLSAQIHRELLLLLAGEAAPGEPAPNIDPMDFPAWLARWLLASFPGGADKASKHLMARWFPLDRLLRDRGEQLQANSVPVDTLEHLGLSVDLFLTIMLYGHPFRQTAGNIGVAVEELLRLANSSAGPTDQGTREKVMRYILGGERSLYDGRVSLADLLATLVNNHQVNAARWINSERQPHLLAPHSGALYRKLSSTIKARPRGKHAAGGATAWPGLPAALRGHRDLPDGDVELYCQLSALQRFRLARLLGRKFEPNPRVQFVSVADPWFSAR